MKDKIPKSEKEFKDKLPKVGCAMCHDGGWADGYILTSQGAGRVVRKCQCLIAREKAKAVANGA
jgi:hypothetical protein